MTPPAPDIEVDPDALDESARKIDGVAREICGARETLAGQGDIPTLDPLAKAAKIASSCAGIAMTLISEQIDPYPPIRAAWEDALERYCHRFGANAQGLRDTAEEYRSEEAGNRGRIEHLYPHTEQIPTVPPSEPTAPMPTVPPGEPTVPMPETGAADSDGPVAV